MHTKRENIRSSLSLLLVGWLVCWFVLICLQSSILLSRTLFCLLQALLLLLQEPILCVDFGVILSFLLSGDHRVISKYFSVSTTRMIVLLTASTLP